MICPSLVRPAHFDKSDILYIPWSLTWISWIIPDSSAFVHCTAPIMRMVGKAECLSWITYRKTRETYVTYLTHPGNEWLLYNTPTYSIHSRCIQKVGFGDVIISCSINFQVKRKVEVQHPKTCPHFCWKPLFSGRDRNNFPVFSMGKPSTNMRLWGRILFFCRMGEMSPFDMYLHF